MHMAADPKALQSAGFSLVDSPDLAGSDPYHVSIGGLSPGIVQGSGGYSWPGNKQQRQAIRDKLQSVFTNQVWPLD